MDPIICIFAGAGMVFVTLIVLAFVAIVIGAWADRSEAYYEGVSDERARHITPDLTPTPYPIEDDSILVPIHINGVHTMMRPGIYRFADVIGWAGFAPHQCPSVTLRRDHLYGDMDPDGAVIIIGGEVINIYDTSKA